MSDHICSVMVSPSLFSRKRWNTLLVNAQIYLSEIWKNSGQFLDISNYNYAITHKIIDIIIDTS
jgi:hypothetical protein